MWKKSLKARLTIYVVMPVMVALIIIGVTSSYSAYNEAQEIYDAELSHVANLMFLLLSAEDKEEAKHSRAIDDEEVKHDIVELGNDFDDTKQRQERNLAFRIWRNGKLMFYSKKSSNFGDERVTAGFSNQEINGKEWRFYVLPDAKSKYTIEVAQKLNIRLALIKKVMTAIFSPLILLLPIILILTWIGLRLGLKPLLAISDAVKNRSALDLAPLPNINSLTEITPLISSINSLLSKLDYALQKERRFTDFAAHELRTPISIFKTQAQTALKATDEDQRKTILEAQVRAANRATSMVDQLLTLARLEHADIPTEKLFLNAIAKELVQERLPLAKNKEITINVIESTQAFITGNKELLTIILSNLIDNSIKYTPENGEVIVSISAQDQSAIISVSDNGQGIPEESLPFITERFYRVTNQNHQPGAGLGLTIVKRASEIMNANLTLQNKKTGTGFESILEFNSGYFIS